MRHDVPEEVIPHVARRLRAERRRAAPDRGPLAHAPLHLLGLGRRERGVEVGHVRQVKHARGLEIEQWSERRVAERGGRRELLHVGAHGGGQPVRVRVRVRVRDRVRGARGRVRVKVRVRVRLTLRVRIRVRVKVKVKVKI